MAATPPAKPSASRRGVVQRFTGKVGPLPVWAWAALILVVGYLVYRVSGAGKGSSADTSATTDSATADTPTTSGDSGNPPAGGGGNAADNMNGDLLSSLGGLQGSVDSLTALVQSTPAFGTGDGNSGDSGSGSLIPNGTATVDMPRGTGAAPATSTPARPAAAHSAPATVRYYTFAPGKAPKGRTGDQAPARGPAGTSLKFARGKGYYYG